MKYTVQFFIDKFEKIPGNKWTTNTYTQGDKHCAGGHCGMRFADDINHMAEAKALVEVLRPSKAEHPYYSTDFHNIVAALNDGVHSRYKQPTPKQRILAALYDIKAMQQPAIEQYPDLTRQLAVLPSDRREVDREETVEIVTPLNEKI